MCPKSCVAGCLCCARSVSLRAVPVRVHVRDLVCLAARKYLLCAISVLSATCAFQTLSFPACMRTAIPCNNALQYLCAISPVSVRNISSICAQYLRAICKRCRVAGRRVAGRRVAGCRVAGCRVAGCRVAGLPGAGLPCAGLPGAGLPGPGWPDCLVACLFCLDVIFCVSELRAQPHMSHMTRCHIIPASYCHVFKMCWKLLF